MGAAWRWGCDNLRGFPLGENPFLAVAKKAEERSPRYVPPLADFWKVFDYVAANAESSEEYSQDQVMLLAYLHLAARRSELFKAKWSDVDLAHGQFRLGTRKRKGGLEYDWLPMTEELQAEMAMWLERRLGLSTMDKQHIFVCLSPLPCCDPHYGLPFKQRRWAMGRWCDKVEVTPFGWHAIRHLTASELYHKGYPKSHIQRVLRHRSATTTDIYLRSLDVGQELRATLNDGLSRGKVIEFDPKKTTSSGRA